MEVPGTLITIHFIKKNLYKMFFFLPEIYEAICGVFCIFLLQPWSPFYRVFFGCFFGMLNFA